jgi:hypothetical protein
MNMEFLFNKDDHASSAINYFQNSLANQLTY